MSIESSQKSLRTNPIQNYSSIPNCDFTPMKDFDEEFYDDDNPLNKAMIKEHTAAGFRWTKNKFDYDTENFLDKLKKNKHFLNNSF